MNTKDSINQEIAKTARIIKLARRLRGLTQVELAKKINVAQSTISKYESAILLPDVSFWFTFCKLVGIDAQSSFEQGRISKQFAPQNIEAKISSLKISPEYGKSKFIIHAIQLYPIVEASKQLFGIEAVNLFLKSKKIDEDIFFIDDFEFGANFLEDYFQYFHHHPSFDKLITKASGIFGELTSNHAPQSVNEITNYFTRQDNIFTIGPSPISNEHQTVSLKTKVEVYDVLSTNLLDWLTQYRLNCFELYLKSNKKTQSERNNCDFNITIIQ